MENQYLLQDSTVSTYDAAMEALSSLITKPSEDRSTRPSTGNKFHMMARYLKILGLDQCINELKVIHVAGTKGKGSTCAFSEAILRECGLRTGLFTSPHLVDVTERIRLNGSDISREKFLHYFWDLWNHLKERVNEDLPMPRLFQFLTLLAFQVFYCEKVDVAIVEVGCGGRWDSTNIVQNPVVCGVTSLGMDHMEKLGNTLGKIAYAKAGIFKNGIPAFTVPQLPEAMSVLKEVASELMVPLHVVQPLDSETLRGVKIALDGDHQYINAGLAAALCKCWLERTGYPKLPSKGTSDEGLTDTFIRGLSTARLSGRSQIMIDKKDSSNLIFYLDGAHTPESLEVCAIWFSNAAQNAELPSEICNSTERIHENGNSHKLNGNGCQYIETSRKILLFNCMEKRDPQLLLPALLNTSATHGANFFEALFVPSLSTHDKVGSSTTTVATDTEADLSWQYNLQRTWENLIHDKLLSAPSSNGNSAHFRVKGDHFQCSKTILSLPLAIQYLRESSRANPSIRYQVLVCGSLHLVGDVIKILSM